MRSFFEAAALPPGWAEPARPFSSGADQSAPNIHPGSAVTRRTTVYRRFPYTAPESYRYLTGLIQPMGTRSTEVASVIKELPARADSLPSLGSSGGHYLLPKIRKAEVALNKYHRVAGFVRCAPFAQPLVCHAVCQKRQTPRQSGGFGNPGTLAAHVAQRSERPSLAAQYRGS